MIGQQVSNLQNAYTQSPQADDVRVIWRVGVAKVNARELITVEGSGLMLTLESSEAVSMAHAILAAAQETQK